MRGLTLAWGNPINFTGFFNDIPGHAHSAKWTLWYVDTSGTTVLLPTITGATGTATMFYMPEFVVIYDPGRCGPGTSF